MAISSSIFLLIATLTGIVLAFEPIATELQGHQVDDTDDITLDVLIETMRSQYVEVIEIEQDAYGYVRASVISDDPKTDGYFYIDPRSGAKIADIPEKSELFEFMTNLHRSLFLKTPGRLFVGLTSFLLCLIVVTGLALGVQRQGSVIKFFRHIVRDDFYRYYHVVTGRWAMVPVLIIALTGCYLSLLRFSIAPSGERIPLEISDQVMSGDILSATTLRELRKIEFPFSSDEEDYFLISLRDREIAVQQYTGEVMEQSYYPMAMIMARYSSDLHTGKGSVIWSIVLLLACLNILFFMYSGFAITFKRFAGRAKNKYSADEANHIILVGSENGSTHRFAKLLYDALLRVGESAYVAPLNDFQHYPEMQELIILTSTYGDGEPPANAAKFLSRLATIHQDRTVRVAVVGFGSHAYERFCQYAVDVYEAIAQRDDFALDANEPYLIHNQSYDRYKAWVRDWANRRGLSLALPTALERKKVEQISFEIIDRRVVQDDYDVTYTLQLRPKKASTYQAGDLLSVTPMGDELPRLYSIGTTAENDILLSIKVHEQGICSRYLYGFYIGDQIMASIEENEFFHLPESAPVIMIANGTGIAPFFGMIDSRADQCRRLYWGGRSYASYELYRDRIAHAMAAGTLCACETAYSREESIESYVQDLIQRDRAEIQCLLSTGAYIMICGSVAMYDGVMEVLSDLCQGDELLDWQQISAERVLADCY